MLLPATTLRAILADTLRNGYAHSRELILWAAAGLLAQNLLIIAAGSLLPSAVFFAALGIFGAVVLGSIGYDLWRTQEIPEDEPLFSHQRIFFTCWLSGSYWMIGMTVNLPLAMFWTFSWEWGKWAFVGLFIITWLSGMLILSKKYDEFRFFFQAGSQASWLFRLSSLVLFLLSAYTLWHFASFILHQSGNP